MSTVQLMSRRVRVLVGLAVGCVLLAGCASTLSAAPATSDGPVLAGDAAGSGPVIASPIYALQVGEAAQASRITQMAAVIDGLRAASSSGWQAKQSDRNGWAADVSGGWFRADGDPVAVASAFMSSYGSVFGPATGMVATSGGYDTNGLATVRITQVVGTVPVDGALLTASVRQYGNGGQLESIRGLLLDTTGVTDTPTITAAQAETTVTDTLGATITPGATLAITDTLNGPRLAWAVTAITGPTNAPPGTGTLDLAFPATVFVDATDGAILSARPNSEHLTSRGGIPAEDAAAGNGVDYGNYTFTLPAGGTPVTIQSDYLGLFPIQVTALQLPDGSIAMVDPTGPGASLATKKGLIAVVDAKQHDAYGGDLGAVAVYPNVQAIPKDAIYAMWGVRQTLDVLAQRFGLASFDNNNSPVPIVINYLEGDTCLDNAFFLTGPGVSHMSTGVPCPDDQGRRRETMATIEVLGHEIGHGVTNSHTSFFYPPLVEQTALDEGTSDYIGMLVRNAAFGEDGTVMLSDSCKGSGDWDPFCVQWKDGAGMRSMSTGATAEQSVFRLEDPYRDYITYLAQDDGHNNGMVWTNALIQARRAIAAAAGEDPATSARAQVFDQAVLRADTAYYEPNTGLAQAADAVLRAAGDLGMSQQERDLISDRFRANKLCRGCLIAVGSSDQALPVSVSTSLKTNPVAAGDRAAYILNPLGGVPIAVAGNPGDPVQQNLSAPGQAAITIAASGDRVYQGQLRQDTSGYYSRLALTETNLTTGTSTDIATEVDPIIAPAASAEGVAWSTVTERVCYRAVSGGKPKCRSFGEATAALATSRGKVAVLTVDGTLSVWSVANDTVRALATMSAYPFYSLDPPGRGQAPLGSMAMSGDRIALVASALFPGDLVVFDLGEQTSTTYSSTAVPLGVAINDKYVVWVDYAGPQQTPLAGAGPWANDYADTQLTGFSFVDGKYYEMVDHRGQQGFPSLSDELLVWQESANGTADIYALPLQQAAPTQ